RMSCSFADLRRAADARRRVGLRLPARALPLAAFRFAAERGTCDRLRLLRQRPQEGRRAVAVRLHGETRRDRANAIGEKDRAARESAGAVRGYGYGAPSSPRSPAGRAHLDRGVVLPVIRPPFDRLEVLEKLRPAYAGQHSLMLPGACHPSRAPRVRFKRFDLANRAKYEFADLRPSDELHRFAEALTGARFTPAWTRPSR